MPRRATIKMSAKELAAVAPGKARGKAATAPKAKRKPKPPPERAPLSPDAVVLSLDPSSTAIGYAVFVGRTLATAGRVPAAPSGWDAARRMAHNSAKTVEVIRWLEREKGLSPDVVLIEWASNKVNSGRSGAGISTLCHAQGYLLAILNVHMANLNIELISEREWTRWSGKAMNRSKEERARRIAEEAPDYLAAVTAGGKSDKGLDVADAIGLGMWRLGIIK